MQLCYLWHYKGIKFLERNVVKTHEYNYEINVLVKLFRRSLRVSKGPTTFSNR